MPPGGPPLLELISSPASRRRLTSSRWTFDRRPRGRSATRAAASRRIDPLLADELKAQQARLPPSPARDANLAALVAGETAVVATGQQVGLFLGPLYAFYKAASAVAVARALAEESRRPGRSAVLAADGGSRLRRDRLLYRRRRRRRAGAALAGRRSARGLARLGRPPAARSRGRPAAGRSGRPAAAGPGCRRDAGAAAGALPGGGTAGCGLRRADGPAVRRRRVIAPRPAGRAGRPARAADHSPGDRRDGADWRRARPARGRAGGGRLRRADPGAARLLAGLFSPRTRHRPEVSPVALFQRLAAGRVRPPGVGGRAGRGAGR